MPMDAGAGNKLHPGPGPMALPPGPCSSLTFVDAGAVAAAIRSRLVVVPTGRLAGSPFDAVAFGFNLPLPATGTVPPVVVPLPYPSQPAERSITVTHWRVSV